MAFIASTSLAGLSNSPSVPVPSGAQAGDDVIIICTRDAPAENYAASKPADFETFDIASLTADGQQIFVGHKKLSGADSGSYTFGTQPDSWYWVCQAFLFRDRHITDPIPSDGITVAELNTPGSSPLSITASGLTAEAGDDLLWLAATDTTSGTTGVFAPPNGFTEREDSHAEQWANLSGATKENVSAGNTGDATGTFTASGVSAGYAAYLIRLKAAASESGPAVSVLVSGIGAPSATAGSLKQESASAHVIGTTSATASLLHDISGVVELDGETSGTFSSLPEASGKVEVDSESSASTGVLPHSFAEALGVLELSASTSELPVVAANVLGVEIATGITAVLITLSGYVVGSGVISGTVTVEQPGPEGPQVYAVVSGLGQVSGDVSELGNFSSIISADSLIEAYFSELKGVSAFVEGVGVVYGRIVTIDGVPTFVIIQDLQASEYISQTLTIGG